MTEPRPDAPTVQTILVVEDDYLLAKAMAVAFAAAGVNVLGPVSNVDDALDLVEGGAALDGAVLDVNLQGEMVYPVAEVLRARGVPFVFATGYDGASITPAYRQVPCCQKPVDPDIVIRMLFG